MNTSLHFATLLDLLLKSAVLLALGAMLLTALRGASAANRHVLSAAMFAALLLLPFTKFLPARWSFALERAARPTVRMRLPAIVQQSSSQRAESGAGEISARSVVRAPLVIPWQALAFSGWCVGAALLLARRGLIAIRVHAVVRRSEAIADGHLAAVVNELVAASGVRAEVRESAHCRVPLVAGVVRPVVLLPVEAKGWDDALIFSALCHELGHIRRGDCLTRLLADVVCALYWLNPLAWFAARRMRLAQEQACDDLVLNSGARADEYAGHLVAIVRSLQGDRFTARHALAMAQPSTLETRVLSIVDATRDRRPRSVRTALAGFAFVMMALTLCSAAQLRGADERKPALAGAVQAGPQPGGAEIFTREWKVPPGLFPPGNVGGAAQSAAQDFLEKKGIVFGPGAVATFNPERSSLIVRNTRAQLDRIDLFFAERVKPGREAAPAPPRLEILSDSVTFDQATGTLKAHGNVRIETADAVLRADAVDVVPKKKDGAAGREETLVFPKVEFRDATMREIVDFLTAKSKRLDPKGAGVNILLRDAKKFDDVRITLSLANVSIEEALKYAAGLGNGELVKEKFAFVIQPTGAGAKPAAPDPLEEKGAAKPPGIPAPLPGAGAALKKAGAIFFPKIDLRDAPLSETIDFLREKAKALDPDKQGVNLILVPGANGDDPKITLSLTNIPLTEALRYVAALAGFEFSADDHAITIRPASK